MVTSSGYIMLVLFKNVIWNLNDFTVLTGPQSSGKSTVAKAVYFFRTVKQDILNIIMQGGRKQYRTGMTLPGPWSWNSA